MELAHSVDRAGELRLAAAGTAVGALAIGAGALFSMPVIPIAVVAAPIALAIAWYRPFLLCLMFVAFSFFRVHEAIPALQPLHIPQALGVLAFVGLAWHLFLARTATPFWPPELKIFLAFFVLTTLGMVFALNKPLAFAYWSDVYCKIGIMTLAIAWLMRTPDDVTLAARVVLACGLLISVIAIHNKMSGIGLIGGDRVTIGRDFHSPIGDPNDLALALLFPLGFAIAFAGHKCGALNRLLGLAAIPTILTAIVFTQSRGGLIGVLAVFSVSALRMFKAKTVFLAIGVVAAFALFAVTEISSRPDVGVTDAGIDESSMDRLHAWRAATNMAIARPLTGVGLSNFSDSIYFYTDHWANFRDMVAHSTWFTVLGETGFPGFALFVAMVVAIYLSASRSARLFAQPGAPPVMCAISLGLISALVGFCAAGTFLTQTFTWPIYILLALTVGVRRIADEFSAAGSRPAACRKAPASGRSDPPHVVS